MLDYSKLDPNVVPMVKFFNDIGLETSMSCEGHNCNMKSSDFMITFNASDTAMEDFIYKVQIFLDGNQDLLFAKLGRKVNSIHGWFLKKVNIYSNVYVQHLIDLNVSGIKSYWIYLIKGNSLKLNWELVKQDLEVFKLVFDYKD